LIAALLVAFFMSEAKAIMNKGDVAVMPFACVDEESAMTLSKADEKSRDQSRAMFRHLVDEEKCGLIIPPIIIPLERLVHVYTDHAGKLSEIWSVFGRTGREWFTIVMDPNQKSSI